MAKIAKPLSDVIESFERLPGIGPKTAQRLGFYLIRVPQSQLDSFSESLTNLKKLTVICSNCKNVAEEDPCMVCSETGRDKTSILVVEEPFDILVFEKTGKYKGMYHVLHGAINPLENIGPDEIYLEDLIQRVKNDDVVTEVIIATNPTMEGEATAMYITKKLKEEVPPNGRVLKITRLGMGVPTGADLGYADEATLREALDGRRQV
ncbi:MAG TPA: recombination mediator RecR [Patescibacteria group bacterium]